MQIFATSPNPFESAESLRHDKKRRGKMILETAQVLCTALSDYCRVPYKPTHRNHPIMKWCKESSSNFIWLVFYAHRLEDIRIEEGDNPHKSMEVINKIKDYFDYLPQNSGTPFANCTPYKDLPVHEAYRKYLAEKQTSFTL